MEDQVDVVGPQRDQRNSEHGRHEEDEQNVKFSISTQLVLKIKQAYSSLKSLRDDVVD